MRNAIPSKTGPEAEFWTLQAHGKGTGKDHERRLRESFGTRWRTL